MKSPKPKVQVVNDYLQQYEEMDDYPIYTRILEIAFLEIYPENKRIEDVLSKIALLDELYNTNVKLRHRLIEMAIHIEGLNIDERLKKTSVDNPDDHLVHEIARLGKGLSDNGRGDYSFASKYLSFHRPDVYPIFDSNVFEALKYFRDVHRFDDFENEDMYVYANFSGIISDFMNAFGLTDFTIRRIDLYLWQVGRELKARK